MNGTNSYSLMTSSSMTSIVENRSWSWGFQDLEHRWCSFPMLLNRAWKQIRNKMLNLKKVVVEINTRAPKAPMFCQPRLSLSLEVPILGRSSFGVWLVPAFSHDNFSRHEELCRLAWNRSDGQHRIVWWPEMHRSWQYRNDVDNERPSSSKTFVLDKF